MSYTTDEGNLFQTDAQHEKRVFISASSSSRRN